jgi:hypothetical protein
MLLYVFASNIRPQYEQDVLDIIAAPSGLVWHLRYNIEWVNAAARAEWGQLEGTPVLIHFSLQQAAQYHEPAFVPIRIGEVQSTSSEGSFLFLEISLERHVSLAQPSQDSSDKARKVREYASYLDSKGIDRPYRSAVSLGFDILQDGSSPLDHYSDPVSLFERTAVYLEPTESFRSARFLRFLRLVPREQDLGSDLEVDFDRKLQAFKLEAGKTYDLQLLHSQPGDVTTRESYSVDSDGSIVQVVGRRGFDIASRYDRITITIYATIPPAYEARDTLLVVEPAAGVHGPRLRLPVRVESSKTRAAAIAGGTIAALIALGMPAFISNDLLGLKIFLLTAGATVTGILRVFGLGR